MIDDRDGADGEQGFADWAELVARVREVAATCAERELTRLRVGDGDVVIEVRRTRNAVPSAPPPAQAGGTLGPPATNGQSTAPLVDDLVADVVGIFRFSRPAVAVGAPVGPGRELGAVESLGIRNPVSARAPGTVVGVFVEDGQPVDYGRTLFTIER